MKTIIFEVIKPDDKYYCKCDLLPRFSAIFKGNISELGIYIKEKIQVYIEFLIDNDISYPSVFNHKYIISFHLTTI